MCSNKSSIISLPVHMWLHKSKGTSCRKTQFSGFGVQSQNIIIKILSQHQFWDLTYFGILNTWSNRHLGNRKIDNFELLKQLVHIYVLSHICCFFAFFFLFFLFLFFLFCMVWLWITWFKSWNCQSGSIPIHAMLNRKDYNICIQLLLSPWC